MNIEAFTARLETLEHNIKTHGVTHGALANRLDKIERAVAPLKHAHFCQTHDCPVFARYVQPTTPCQPFWADSVSDNGETETCARCHNMVLVAEDTDWEQGRSLCPACAYDRVDELEAQLRYERARANMAEDTLGAVLTARPQSSYRDEPLAGEPSCPIKS